MIRRAIAVVVTLAATARAAGAPAPVLLRQTVVASQPSTSESPEAFKAAARALLQSGLHQTSQQRRLLSESSSVLTSAASASLNGLQNSIANILDTLEGSSVTDLFKQIPIVGNILQPTTTSENRADDLGSLLQQLLVVRGTNLNLYEGLQDVEAAWKAVPILGGKALPNNGVSPDSAKGSGLFGLKGLIESLANDNGIALLSQVDVNSLDGAADNSAFTPLFGSGKLFNILAPAVSTASAKSDSDAALIAMAANEEQQVAQALALTSSLQGTTNQLISLFTGGILFPFRVAVNSIQSAVDVIINFPAALGSYQGLGRAVGELLLDVQGVAYGYDLSTNQSGIVGGLVSYLMNFINWLGGLTAQVLDQGFFETLYGYLVELGQWLVKFDSEPLIAKLKQSGLDMSFSIANKGGLIAQTQFSTVFPFITNGFGLTISVMGRFFAAGAKLTLNFAGFGLTAFLAVTLPFFRLAATGLDLFRSILQIAFIKVPAMLLDSLGISAFLQTLQQTFSDAVGSIAGLDTGGKNAASLPDDFAALNALTGAFNTDFVESLLLQGSGNTVDSTILALVKSVTLQESLGLSSQLGDLLASSATRIADVFSWPLNLVSDFMTAGMTSVLGTVASIISTAGLVGINGSSGLISLFTGGLLSTTPISWRPGSNTNYGLLSTVFGRQGRRLQEADDAMSDSPQAAALEVAASGVVMVLGAVAEIGDADIPCHVKDAAADIFNSAVIAGDPARLLQAAGVGTDDVDAILSLSPEALEIASNVQPGTLCEAQKAALKALGTWARTGIQSMEDFVHGAVSSDVEVVNAAIQTLSKSL